MKFTAVTRKEQGTSASRRLRRENKVPGIVYGNNVEATPIALDHNELFYNLQKEKFHASILDMELDGKEELVVLRAFQMHPYKPQVMHCDFQRVDPNAEVTMRVPLHFFGGENSPAVKVDKGFISHHAQGYARIRRSGSLRHDEPDDDARCRREASRRRACDRSGNPDRHRDRDRRRYDCGSRCCHRRRCGPGCCRGSCCRSGCEVILRSNHAPAATPVTTPRIPSMRLTPAKRSAVLF